MSTHDAIKEAQVIERIVVNPRLYIQIDDTNRCTTIVRADPGDQPLRFGVAADELARLLTALERAREVLL